MSSWHLTRLIDEDRPEDDRAFDLERPERPSFFPPRPAASGPLPLLAGGRRAHALTDQEVRVIAEALDTCSALLADVGSQALTLGALRRQLLHGIGDPT